MMHVLEETGCDALLDEWMIVLVRKVDSHEQGVALMGVVYWDRAARWPDGRHIMTSQLVSCGDNLSFGAVVETLNSRYLLARSASDATH